MGKRKQKHACGGKHHDGIKFQSAKAVDLKVAVTGHRGEKSTT